MIQSLCRTCGAVCPPGRKRCDKHRKRDTRPSAHARGYDAKHRAERTRLLREHPICSDPFNEGCTNEATVLDHIDGFGPKGPSGHSRANHDPLCSSCHGRKTAAQTPGGWNA